MAKTGQKKKRASDRKLEIMRSENSIYANWAQVSGTNNELRVTFGEIVEASPERLATRELARVYMTFRVAKELLAILAQGIENHEKQFGVIQPNEPGTKA